MRDRSRNGGQAGFSLMELLLYVAMFPVLAIAAISVVDVGGSARSVGSTKIQLDRSVRVCLRRLHDEILAGSKVAEDANGNKLLDSGEDLNNNGRLDADWAVGPSSITFNRRLRNSTFSLPITYRLLNGELERSVMLNPGGTTIRTVIAKNVNQFTLTESTGEVVVNLALQKTSKGRTLSESGSVRILIRN
ncbi:MAG: type II secretion system protein J [Planctomycetota bacterium]